MWFSPVLSVPAVLAGVWITARQPRNPIGWLCSAVGISSALTSAAFGYRMLSEAGIAAWPGVEVARWLNLWVWIPANMLPMTFLLLLFPEGRLPSQRWWPISWAAGLGLMAFSLAVALHPNPPLEPTPTPNPFGIAGAEGILSVLMLVASILSAIGVLGSLAALVARFRRARGVEREQLKWLVYATVLTLLVSSPVYAWYAARPSNGMAFESMLISMSFLIAAIATAIGIAIRRYRLYDIDLVINRTLVYGVLTAAVAGVYVLVVGGLGVLFQAQGSVALSLLGVGIVALVVQPVRDRLQRAVNRLMYGPGRDDPYMALSRLGQRLEGTLAPEAILPNIVEVVAQTLKLPYVAIALARPSDSLSSTETFPVVAAYGSSTPDSLRLPLVYQSETIGALIVGPRAGERFSSADLRLLDDLARQAGMAVHAVRLTADLQRSREQLVAAREEERRRLRRDLHDGLGSQFAALHLRADTLRALIPTAPAEAEAVAIELRDEIRAAVADIRRLVYELRPPALDELGLAGAMRALAAQRTSANGLHVIIDAPEPLPPLPAAVEVAAYRIVQEALTNVVRHARAHTCRIRLALADDLRLEIKDDGIGLPIHYLTGVGLRSMRERAAELGGTCAVETAGEGGARVLACLPCRLRGNE